MEMGTLEKPAPPIVTRIPRQRILSRTRIVLALAVAIVADGVQFLLNGFGWFGVDQAIDVLAMVLTVWILGFHLLLLPTFALEFLPVTDMLPTWTACVAGVIALRKRAERQASSNLEIQKTGSN